MTFTVFMYAVGGYAVLVLAAVLVVEKVRDPGARRPRRSTRHSHAQLRAWPRASRRCPVANESLLPLRSARLARRPAGGARRPRPAGAEPRALAAHHDVRP